MKFIICLIFISITQVSFSQDAAKDVRYKKAEKINFENLLIEGQQKRPDITVVTGNVGNEGDGLLKLRENFIDQVAIDAGGSVK